MLIPFLMLIFSCEEERTDELLINSTVEIEMHVAPAAGTGEVVLHCKTLKEYICYNYVIGYSKAGEGKSLKINFRHVSPHVSGKCGAEVGPATAEINLGTLETGIYTIELNNGVLENRGTLEITSTELVLDFPQQKGIDILTPVVLR